MILRGWAKANKVYHSKYSAGRLFIEHQNSPKTAPRIRSKWFCGARGRRLSLHRLDIFPSIEEKYPCVSNMICVCQIQFAGPVGRVSLEILVGKDLLSSPRRDWHAQLDDIQDFLVCFKQKPKRTKARETMRDEHVLDHDFWTCVIETKDMCTQERPF